MKSIYIGKDIIIKVLFMITIFMSIFPNILTFVSMSLYILMIKLATPVLLISFLIFCNKRLYYNKLVLAWIAIYIGMNVITLISGGKFDNFDNIAMSISVLIICSYMCEYDKKFFISFLVYYFTVLLVLNTLLWRPGGTFVNSNGQRAFVIGTKTTITYYQIAACLFAFVYLKTEVSKVKKSIVGWSLFFSIAIYNVLEPISTSIVCFIAFIGMAVFDAINTDMSKKILRYGYWAVTLLDISIAVFRIQYLFKFFLVDVLGEGLTLDGRTIIWDEIFTHIVKKPVLGYGLNSGITFINNFNTSAHNQLISWTFTFGIVGAVCMVLFCGWLDSRFSIDEMSGRIARIVCINLALYWLAEQMMTNYIYIIITIVLFNLDKYEMNDSDNFVANYFYIGR